jgi:hypothetical protein
MYGLAWANVAALTKRAHVPDLNGPRRYYRADVIGTRRSRSGHFRGPTRYPPHRVGHRRIAHQRPIVGRPGRGLLCLFVVARRGHAPQASAHALGAASVQTGTTGPPLPRRRDRRSGRVEHASSARTCATVVSKKGAQHQFRPRTDDTGIFPDHTQSRIIRRCGGMVTPPRFGRGGRHGQRPLRLQLHGRRDRPISAVPLLVRCRAFSL